MWKNGCATRSMCPPAPPCRTSMSELGTRATSPLSSIPKPSSSAQPQADPQRPRSGALNGAVAIDAGLDKLVRDILAAGYQLNPLRHRPGCKGVERHRAVQRARVEVVLELRPNAPKHQLRALAPIVPPARERGREIGCLRRPQAVEEGRCTARSHPRMSEARASSHGPRPTRPLRGSFDPAHLNSVDILALAVRAAGGDEADAFERARPLAQGHIGNRVLQAVGESCQRQAHCTAAIFDPGFRAGELFGIELRI